MKIFTNKSMIRKIAIILVVLLLFSFISPIPNNISHAADGDGGIGGALFRPILDLLVGVADWVISFIQQSLFGINESLVHINRGGDFWSTFFGIVVAIIVVAGCVALTVITAGGAAAGLLTIAGAILGSAVTTLIIGGVAFVGTKYVTKQMLPNDLYLPVIEISPEAIFKRRYTNF